MKLNLSTLPRVNVVLMVVLTLATLGIYFPVWYLRRLPAFNRLRSPVKIGPALPVAVLVLYVTTMSTSVVRNMFMGVGASALAALFSGSSTILGLAQGAMILVLAFQAREILEDHLRISMGGVWTFLFNAYYLQWTINQHHAELAEASAPAPTDAATG